MSSQGPSGGPAPFPKIELHVHFEATVRPETLLRIARKNHYRLPADTVEGLAELFRFRDFMQFIDTWIAVTPALQTADDFRQIVVEYAAEASALGAVYIEGIFSPAEPVLRGVRWRQVFEGYCDGRDEARERYGIEVNFTPDITRSFSRGVADKVVKWCLKYRDRGVVGVGLGGPEELFPPEPFTKAFARARSGGLGSVPHAGESGGPALIRATIDSLQPDRIRHGIRAVDDAGLLVELVERGIVLDVTPVSNLRTRVVPSLDDHPLPRLVAAGVPCSISTDDPALFQTDLDLDYAVAARLCATPEYAFRSALAGALCGEATRTRLARLAGETDWSAAVPRAAAAVESLEG